jgi:hypothetical protein
MAREQFDPIGRRPDSALCKRGHRSLRSALTLRHVVHDGDTQGGCRGGGAGGKRSNRPTPEFCVVADAHNRLEMRTLDLVAIIVVVVVVSSHALTPQMILSTDIPWRRGAAEARAQQLWEPNTAMPLYFLPVWPSGLTERQAGLREEGKVLTSWPSSCPSSSSSSTFQRLCNLYKMWEEAFKKACAAPARLRTGKTTSGVGFTTCLSSKDGRSARSPCEAPEREYLISEGCKRGGCQQPDCASSCSFDDFEMEHIVGKASGEMRLGPAEMNILGNTVMALGPWNREVGQDGFLEQKVLVYGKLLSYAARYWVETCEEEVRAKGAGSIAKKLLTISATWIKKMKELYANKERDRMVARLLGHRPFRSGSFGRGPDERGPTIDATVLLELQLGDQVVYRTAAAQAKMVVAKAALERFQEGLVELHKSSKRESDLGQLRANLEGAKTHAESAAADLASGIDVLKYPQLRWTTADDTELWHALKEAVDRLGPPPVRHGQRSSAPSDPVADWGRASLYTNDDWLFIERTPSPALAGRPPCPSPTTVPSRPSTDSYPNQLATFYGGRRLSIEKLKGATSAPKTFEGVCH